MSKLNLHQSVPLSGSAEVQQFSDLLAEAEKVNFRLVNTRGRFADTAHALISSNLAVYGRAGLNLLQQHMFLDAFKLLDAGFKHLYAKSNGGMFVHYKEFDLLVQNVWLTADLYEPVLSIQLCLVKAVLLHSSDSPECFKAFSTLDDYYRFSNKNYISERLAEAYEEIRQSH